MPRSRRRPRRSLRPADWPQQAALRALRRAHRLLETGQYAQAYPALTRLADGAAEGGRPLQAATLYAQAARARIEMAAPGAANAAIDAAALGQRMLRLLVGAGRPARAQALLARLIQALESKGYRAQAVALRAEGRALLGGSGAGAPDRASQAVLPAHCPSCNAPLRADEVEWLDAGRAECAYCGSVVRAE